jgi:anion-transporting  ArsA/GET3 family ATPase
MAEFSALLKAKETSLQRLFDEWNEVQTAIIALAVQTLGQDAVVIEEDRLHPALTDAMKEGAAEHATAASQTTTHQDKVDKIETQTKDLANKTVNAVDEAFKVSTRLTILGKWLTTCRPTSSRWKRCRSRPKT